MSLWRLQLFLLCAVCSSFRDTLPVKRRHSRVRSTEPRSLTTTSTTTTTTLYRITTITTGQGPRIPSLHRHASSTSDSNGSNSQLVPPPCVIKVIGVGGGGGNAVNHMVRMNNNNGDNNSESSFVSSLQGVSFWSMNTDAQALSSSLASASNRLQLGRTLTRGLGAGGDARLGMEAALENAADIKRIVNDADLVFITAGMGGGTGSGAAPIVADIAKRECGCLTVGVVTKPFGFEGRRRMQQANEAIANLRNHVDTLIVVSNDKLLQIVPDDAPITEAFAVADDILRQGVIGLSDIIVRTGLVNVDFADVRAVMNDAGAALLGTGTGSGPNRATDAAVAAISSPLLEAPIRHAKRVVFNIYGGPAMGLSEINAASAVIYQNCDENANIIFGALIDPTMGDTMSITVLACDFDDSTFNSPAAPPSLLSRPTTTTTTRSLPSSSESPTLLTTTTTISRRSDDSDKSDGLEEARVLIKRGFKRPVDPIDDPARKKGGLFRSLFGK